MKAMMLLLLVIAGCVQLSNCRTSLTFIRQDVNTCAANPKALPDCIIGIKVMDKCDYDI